ncbi:hypothetical protein [Paenalcaligenes faecalis]|uniref:hypothetical protein n=1 Tax=Paenalcaligenes faecalis TaxID=2980099 RepID=UPI0022B954C8|nr:hypothetical protein [Paenalcaligenes faecalis]
MSYIKMDLELMELPHMETKYLLKSPRNASRLREAIAQVKRSNVNYIGSKTGTIEQDPTNTSSPSTTQNSNQKEEK